MLRFRTPDDHRDRVCVPKCLFRWSRRNVTISSRRGTTANQAAAKRACSVPPGRRHDRRRTARRRLAQAGRTNGSYLADFHYVGESVTSDGYSYGVPKRDLVAVLQVLLQTRRLKIAGNLAEAPRLMRELTDFRAKFTPSANEVFRPEKSSQHDDLVLALALAAWTGERLPEPIEWPFETKPDPPKQELIRLQKAIKAWEEQEDREDYGYNMRRFI